MIRKFYLTAFLILLVIGCTKQVQPNRQYFMNINTESLSNFMTLQSILSSKDLNQGSEGLPKLNISFKDTYFSYVTQTIDPYATQKYIDAVLTTTVIVDDKGVKNLKTLTASSSYYIDESFPITNDARKNFAENEAEEKLAFRIAGFLNHYSSSTFQ